MANVYYGCDEVPKGWERYFSECTLIELDLDDFDARPKISTLNGWRVESPKGFAFVLHATSDFVEELVRIRGAEQTEVTDALRDEWDVIIEHASALAAKAVLLQTPAEFSPGPLSEALLANVSSELAKPSKPALIWESSGLWSLGTSREFARTHDIVYAHDPFIAHRDELGHTHGDACWILTERAGMRRKFDQFDLERLVRWAENYDRAFVLLRGRFKWDHAREMRHAVEYA
jgi:uncharacterized protein YecE (DUF72 family)